MELKDMHFKIASGCDRGLCRRGIGRQDKQLNTYDYLDTTTTSTTST